MKKSYYVYFVNGEDNVLMGYENKKAFATLDLNEAKEFESENEAKKFIKALQSKTNNCPKFHVIEFINL